MIQRSSGDSISRQYECEYELAEQTGSWRSGEAGGAVKKEEHSREMEEHFREMEEHFREMQQPAHRPRGRSGRTSGRSASSFLQLRSRG